MNTTTHFMMCKIIYIFLLYAVFLLCKFLWQRDMAERGHSLESIKASIAARKTDFDAHVGR